MSVFLSSVNFVFIFMTFVSVSALQQIATPSDYDLYRRREYRILIVTVSVFVPRFWKCFVYTSPISSLPIPFDLFAVQNDSVQKHN